MLIGLYLLEASFLPSDGEPRPQEKRKKNEAICVPSKFRFTVLVLKPSRAFLIKRLLPYFRRGTRVSRGAGGGHLTMPCKVHR